MARRKKGDKIDGWINLDKPVGLTSTQALGKVRRLLNAQKAGHAGTLDPLASGVLPIALGEATKTISLVQDALKTYSFTISWGEQRDTDDSEGQVIAVSALRPGHAAIEAALPRYTGEIEQIPPQYSAVKVDGERAYDLAREGEVLELKPRRVYVQSIHIMRHPVTDEIMNQTSFLMTCGKGTYVRSLARDLGRDLGCYGYISALRREAVGGFKAESAISLDNLEIFSKSGALNQALLPLQSVLDDIPALSLRPEEAARLRSGQVLTFVSRPDFERLSKIGLGQDDIATTLATCQDRPVALVDIEGTRIRPVRVLNM